VFNGFLDALRRAGLEVGLGEWQALVRALELDLAANSLDRFYLVARGILCRDETDYDRYDEAFAHFFADVPMPSDTRARLEDWLSRPLERPPLSEEELARLPLLTPEELLRLFEERLRQQVERHDGGATWIGSGGTSPFGQGGQHPSGMRIGEGAQGHGQAIVSARARRFRNYRSDRVVDTRALAMALRRLRRLERDVRRKELDLAATIDRTARNGGDIEIAERAERRNQARLLLLLDTGGSMDPHARAAEALLSAVKAGGGLRELRVFHFHNAIYGTLYSDIAMFKSVPFDKVLEIAGTHWHLLCVGDAWMNPHEMFGPYGSIEWATQDPVPALERLHRLALAFKRRAWLNPVPDRYWAEPTIRSVAEIFPMYPLTVAGVTRAVGTLLRKDARPFRVAPDETDVAARLRSAAMSATRRF